MTTTRTRILWITAVACLLATPLAAWAFVKPLRLLAPALNGVQCPNSQVCIDDLSRLQEAMSLRASALQFVDSRVGDIQKPPRLVFCAHPACASSFGAATRAGYTFGTYGIVVAPRGWQPYYVRHELIHYLQHERLGSVRTWLFEPKWFVEGMAYSMSDDPRRPLPEPMESYRTRFDSWLHSVGLKRLWVAAEAL